MYLADMTEEQVSSYLKSVDIVENQNPVIILELYPLITTSPPSAGEVTCGLPAFPHTKLQIRI
jgi:hypothetical protein